MTVSNGTRWRGREVVIVEAARTPIGRGHREKGWYRDVHPNELLGAAYRAVVERAGIEADLVEHAVSGCVVRTTCMSSSASRSMSARKGAW